MEDSMTSGNVPDVREQYAEDVRRCQRLLYSVAKALLRNEQDVLDAVQEAIIRGWEKRDSLRDPSAFKSWMVRIVINICKNHWKKQRPTVPLKEVPAPDSRAEEIMDVRNAVAALDEKLRLCAVLFFYEDLPIHEIGDILGIPEGTVKSRLHRAKKQLRQALEVYIDG